MVNNGMQGNGIASGIHYITQWGKSIGRHVAMMPRVRQLQTHGAHTR